MLANVTSLNTTLFNITNSHNDGVWSPLTGLTFTVDLAIFLNNGLSLLMFAVEKELRTNFTIYVINLQFVTFLHYALNGYLYVMKTTYQKWPYGDRICNFYIYVFSVIGPWQNSCHVLITMNRLWAVTFPISYRERHGPKMAIGICAGLAIFSHSYLLPRWIIDALNRGFNLKTPYGCTVNCIVNSLVNGLCMAMQTIWLVELIIILASFPYICYKQTTRTAAVGPKKPVPNSTGMVSLFQQAVNLSTAALLGEIWVVGSHRGRSTGSQKKAIPSLVLNCLNTRPLEMFEENFGPLL